MRLTGTDTKTSQHAGERFLHTETEANIRTWARETPNRGNSRKEKKP
jgi:hypothetical protein